MNALPVVSLEHVSVQYTVGGQKVDALRAVDLQLHSGTSTSVVGRSGAGKSTLVSVLSLLRRPTGGRVIVSGEDSAKANDAALAGLRARTVGTVFQSFHLDASFTARQNIMLPWYFSGSFSRADASRRAAELLELLEIPELADRHPDRMSGGQRQRVAIARALFNRPQLLLADEPTGNLDEDTAAKVADILYSLPEAVGAAVVIVTHDPEIAARAQRRITLSRGALSTGPTPRPHAHPGQP